MFYATLKGLNLVVSPKPKFNVPSSTFDPIYRAEPKVGDPDTDCISSKHDDERTPEELSSILHNETHALYGKRRTTISFPCANQDDPGAFWLKEPQDGVNKPNSVDVLPSITRLPQESSSNREPNGPVSIMETSSSTSIKASGGARVRIMLPTNPPPSIYRRLREDMSLYDCSVRTEQRQVIGFNQQRENSGLIADFLKKGTGKRNSAPPVLYNRIQNNQTGLIPRAYGRDESKSDPTPPLQLPPLHIHKWQDQQRLRAYSDLGSNSSYPSKLFELDLSPILEDFHIFADQTYLQQTKTDQIDWDGEGSPLNSSTSSYGELLNDVTTDYFGLAEFGFFGDLSRQGNNGENRWTESTQQQENSNSEDSNILKAFNGYLESGNKILPPRIRYSDDSAACRRGKACQVTDHRQRDGLDGDTLETTYRLHLDHCSMDVVRYEAPDASLGLSSTTGYLSAPCGAVFQPTSRLEAGVSLATDNRTGDVALQRAVKGTGNSKRSSSGYLRFFSSALRRFKRLSVSGKRRSLSARKSHQNEPGIWNWKRLSRVLSPSH